MLQVFGQPTRLCVGGMRNPVQRRRSHALRRTPPLHRDLQVEQEHRNPHVRPTPRDGRVRDPPWTAAHRRSAVPATTSRRRRRSTVQRGAAIDRWRPSTYLACRAQRTTATMAASYTIFTSRSREPRSCGERASRTQVKGQEPRAAANGAPVGDGSREDLVPPHRPYSSRAVSLEGVEKSGADPFRGIQERRTTCRKRGHAETLDPRHVGKTHGEEGAEPRDAPHAREPRRCVREGKPERLAADDGSRAARRRDARALVVQPELALVTQVASCEVSSDAPAGACRSSAAADTVPRRSGAVCLCEATRGR